MIPHFYGFSMRVLYWNRTRLTPEEENELQVTYCELDELLQQSDLCHCMWRRTMKLGIFSVHGSSR